jgi:hypothetical protein
MKPFLLWEQWWLWIGKGGDAGEGDKMGLASELTCCCFERWCVWCVVFIGLVGLVWVNFLVCLGVCFGWILVFGFGFWLCCLFSEENALKSLLDRLSPAFD